MIRKISTLLFLILWTTPVFAQQISCTIEYDARGGTINDSCFPNNGYCNSPGGQLFPDANGNCYDEAGQIISCVNAGWCYKTQGNLRGSEVLDRPASVVQDKPKSTWSSALTAWRTKPGNPVEKPTQQCKKRNWLGTCLDSVIMYVATQQTLKNEAFAVPSTSKAMMPCTKEKGLDCAAPAEESWEYKNGGWHTVCAVKKNDLQPRTGGSACAYPDSCNAYGQRPGGPTFDSQACKDDIAAVDLSRC